MHSRICHTTGAILSFVIILTEIDKINKIGLYSNVRRLKFTYEKMNDYLTYILALVAIVVAIVVVKKVTSCLVKSIVTLAVIGVLAYLYFYYGK